MPSYTLCCEANGSKTIPQNEQPEEQIVEGMKPSCFLFQNILLWQSYIQHTFFIMWLYSNIQSTAALCIRWRNTNIIYYLWLLNTQNILVLNLRKSFFSSVWYFCMFISYKCGSIFDTRHLDEVCHLMPSAKVEQEIQHWVFWLLPVIHSQTTVRVFRAAPKWWINNTATIRWMMND